MTDDPFIAEMLAAEDAGMQVAVPHIMGYHPFSSLPEAVPMRLIGDYRKFLGQQGFTYEEIQDLVRTDVNKASDRLRGLTANMLYLGSARFAVLMHVALLIGIEPLLQMRELWQALTARNFELASELLLQSEWARVVGGEKHEAQRVIDMVRIMRTGLITTEWTQRPH